MLILLISSLSSSALIHIALLSSIPRDRIIIVIVEQVWRFEHRWGHRKYRELMGIILSLLNRMSKITGIERKMESATMNFNR